jgi:ribonucleoside-diphosphate reductase alpha chain
MRSLSLAARGGFVARNLQDLRKVSWDRGQVRLGDVKRLDGHRVPRWHDSEVAALAYAIQQILFRRGFLDEEGNQVPSRVLSKLRRGGAHVAPAPSQSQLQSQSLSNDDGGGTSADDMLTALVEKSAAGSDPHTLLPMHGRPCSTCGAYAVIRKDGCDFCTACGEVGACG